MQSNPEGNAWYLSQFQEILDHYPLVEKVAGFRFIQGISNQHVFQISTASRRYALRSVSKCYQSKHQQVLKWLNAAISDRLDFVPKIELTRCNGGLVFSRNDHWELSGWLPGEPWSGLERPDLFSQAIKALGLFHGCLAKRTGIVSGIPPGLQRRWDILRAGLVENDGILPPHGDAEKSFLSESGLILKKMVPETRLLLPWGGQEKQLFPCWGDARRDNILFENEALTGFVDFEAMRVDSLESDIARLLGDFSCDKEVLWGIAMSDYQSGIPIDWDYCWRLWISGMVCSLMNWQRWISEQTDISEEVKTLRLRRANHVLDTALKCQKHGFIKPMLLQ